MSVVIKGDSNRKVLITGSRGFIGNYLKFNLGRDTIYSLDRNEVDLTNLESVISYLKSKKFDVVIHCAVAGSTNVHEHTYKDMCTNLLITYNLITCRYLYGKLINFCSGAAYDTTRDVDMCDSYDIFYRLPSKPYDRYKNLIARDSSKYHNIYSLRLFGCFGHDEPKYRFISRVLDCCYDDKLFTCDRKEMSFISIYDLVRIVRHIIDRDNMPYNDFNCVYNNPDTLRDVAYKVLEYIDRGDKEHLICMNSRYTYNYTGSSSKLDHLNLDLLGFDESLKTMLKINGYKVKD